MESTGLDKQLKKDFNNHIGDPVGRYLQEQVVRFGYKDQEAHKWWIDSKTESNRKQFSRALLYINKAIEKEPRNVAYLIERGIIRYQLGDLSGASADYDTARLTDAKIFARIAYNGIPGL